jgi:hypothetical protein
VRIGIVHLDKEEQAQSPHRQLDLFASPKIETDRVANLSQTSPNIKTDAVANLGHSYEPNINKQRETPAHEIFKRNKKIQDSVNDLGGVLNLIHIPTQQEVENYFSHKNILPMKQLNSSIITKHLIGSCRAKHKSWIGNL